MIRLAIITLVNVRDNLLLSFIIMRHKLLKLIRSQGKWMHFMFILYYDKATVLVKK